MAKKVVETGAHLGVAFDGDGDRVIFSDEHGHILDGDDVLSICGVDLLKKGRLPGRTVVATIMSNMGLECTLAPYGGKVVRVAVGDRQVFEEMQKMGCYLGGESSGHVIFREFVSTGDGIITALQMLAVMVAKNLSFAELARTVVRLPQVQKSIPVARKPPLDSLPELKTRVEKAQAVLGDKGRVVMRYSGTEDRMRVMVQGEDPSLIESILDELSFAVEKSLGGENGKSEAGC